MNTAAALGGSPSARARNTTSAWIVRMVMGGGEVDGLFILRNIRVSRSLIQLKSGRGTEEDGG